MGKTPGSGLTGGNDRLGKILHSRALSLEDRTDGAVTMEVYFVCIVGRAIRCDGHGSRQKMLGSEWDMVWKRLGYYQCICLNGQKFYS